MARKSKNGRWIRSWRGGRVWRGIDGVETYFIRRTMAGRRYDLATHCTTATFTFSPISTSRRMDRHDWVVTLLSRPGVYAGMSSSDIRNARTGSFPVAGRPRFFDCFP